MALEPGTLLGPYEIVELRGKGGMGEVYRARDTRLDRDVAIKVLPAELTDDETYRKRLEREAKTISQLQHPNVCMLHDIGSEGDIQYLVMEYLEGKTLGDRLQKGLLPIEEALRIGSEIAEGIDAAHRRGVVHRDLKPGNVMLTSTGAKVLDFGLARGGAVPGEVIDTEAATMPATLTEEGRIVGTMPYMSPEQVEGKAADSRSDVWALGCVLYEMATGERPFRGDTKASLVGAILKDRPEPPSRRQPLTPKRFDHIVQRCLEKDPELRWQSARDMGIELESLRSAHSRWAAVMGGRRKWALAAVVLVVLLGAAVWFARSVSLRDRGAPSDARPASGGPSSAALTDTTMILVLPFENLGPAEEAHFTSGVSEEIRTGLLNIDGVGVIARASSEAVHTGGASIREMGTAVGADYILDGTVRWASERVRIAPELIRVADESQLWRESFERVIDDVFAVQSEISAQVARQLDFPLLRADAGAGSAGSRSAEAFRAYLRGREIFSSSYSWGAAMDQFESAVKLDDGFGLAWARLAIARVYALSDFTPARLESIREAVDRAVALCPDLPETRWALAVLRFNEGDREAGRREFETAIEMRPGDAEIAQHYGVFLNRFVRYGAGLDAHLRSLELDPLSPTKAMNVSLTFTHQREYEKADRLLDRARALAEDSDDGALTSALAIKAWNTGIWKGWAAAEVEGWPEPLDQFALMTQFRSWLARGLYDRAMAQLDRFPAEGYVDQWAARPRPFLRARVYEARGEAERALKSFEEARQALEQRRERRPKDGRVWTTLGLACAKLGLDEATRYGERGVELGGPEMDGFTGPYRLYDLARIHALVRDSESAIDRLEDLFEIPAPVSVPLIEAERDFDSLRDLPRYRLLMDQHR